MALSRLGNRTRAGDFTWPGFVDALASLLMVFVFVLMDGDTEICLSKEAC